MERASSISFTILTRPNVAKFQRGVYLEGIALKYCARVIYSLTIATCRSIVHIAGEIAAVPIINFHY